jgi:hypothetical protein
MALVNPAWAVFYIAIALALLAKRRDLFLKGFCVDLNDQQESREVFYLYISFSIVIILLIGASYVIRTHAIGIILTTAAAFMAMAMLRLIRSIRSLCKAAPLAFITSEVGTAAWVFWGLRSNVGI